MPQMEVTLMFAFNATGRTRPGFSQRHVYIPLVSKASDVEDAAIDLMNQRVALNAENVDATQIRISNLEFPRRVHNVYQPNRGSTPPFKVKGGAGAGVKSDQPNSSVKFELANADLQKGGLYMAGIPDAIVRTDWAGPDFTAVPNYSDSLQAFMDTLTHGSWGFKCRLLTGINDVLGYSNEAAPPFRLVIRTDATLPFDASPGDVIQIRGAQTDPRGLPSPNGMWRVALRSEGGGSRNFTLLNSAGVDANTIVKFGTVEDVEYHFTPYAGWKTVQQGTRKRGVGPLRPRGRVKRRILRII